MACHETLGMEWRSGGGAKLLQMTSSKGQSGEILWRMIPCCHFFFRCLLYHSWLEVMLFRGLLPCIVTDASEQIDEL